MRPFSKHQANESAVSRPLEARTARSEGGEVSEAPAAPDRAPAAPEGLDAVSPLRSPGRPRGYAKTGGRAKGSKNRRTKEVEEALRPLIPKAKRKLKALIDSKDDKVAYSACMGVLSYVFGKPIDRQQLSGPNDGPIRTEDATKLDVRELARRTVYLLDLASRDAAESGQEEGHREPRG